MKSRYGYKVVRKVAISGRLRSFLMRQHGMTYGIGGTTERRDGWGPLALFRTKEAALKFAIIEGRGSENAIYRCMYVPTVSTLRKLWCIGHDGKKDTWTHELPKGTILADEVRLTSCYMSGEEVRNERSEYEIERTRRRKQRQSAYYEES